MLDFMDCFSEEFDEYEDIKRYHDRLDEKSKWIKVPVNEIRYESLEADSSAYSSGVFAADVTQFAIDDTTKCSRLAAKINGEWYPVRLTAWKSILDRAKINGFSIDKLPREVLAEVLNQCNALYDCNALVLIRSEKVSAIHSGDEHDYSKLPINRLLEVLHDELDSRFPGNVFNGGYVDNAITTATWSMPAQKDDLVGSYIKMLDANGQKQLASKMTPGIRFMTSDTGVSSVKVAAFLMGGQYPVHIGSCINVDHRNNKTIKDFADALEGLFALFADNIKKLESLVEIELEYPVNCMSRLCKALKMPAKPACEAIKMFEMAYPAGKATAHDVYMAMQEILFIAKTDGFPKTKLYQLEENLARALSVNWSSYDLAKGVDL